MRRTVPSRHLLQIYQNDVPGAVDFKKNIDLATTQDPSYFFNSDIYQKFHRDKQEFNTNKEQIQQHSNRMMKHFQKGYVTYKWGEDLKYYAGWIKDHEDGLTKQAKHQKKNKVGQQLYTLDEKQFDFKTIYQTHIKQKVLIPPGRPKIQMNLRIIEQIQKIQFAQMAEEYQFGDQALQLLKPAKPNKRNKNEEYIWGEMSRSRINNMFLKSYESNSAIKISKNTNQFKIDFARDLNKFPRLCWNYEIPNLESEFTLKQMMLLARGTFNLKMVVQKTKQDIKNTKALKLAQQEVNIEQQLEEITSKIQNIKKIRQDKRKKTFRTEQSQTQKIKLIINSREIMDYDCNQIINNLHNLNDFKIKEIKDKIEPRLVYQDIHQKMIPLLFRLLLCVATGEDFLDMRQMMVYDSQQEAQLYLLALIHKNQRSIEGKIFTNSRRKVEILKIYSGYRLMIEKQGGPKVGVKKIKLIEKKINDQVNSTGPYKKVKKIGQLTPKTVSKLGNTERSITTDRMMQTGKKINVKQFNTPSTRHFGGSILNFSKKFDFTDSNRRGNNHSSLQKKIELLFRSTERNTTPRNYKTISKWRQTK